MGSVTLKTEDILTLILSLYGAILASYTFYVQQREKHPRIKTKLYIVRMMSKFTFSAPERYSGELLMMEAANHGRVPVTLSGVSYQIVGEDRAAFLVDPFMDIKLPYELLPGKSCKVWLKADDFAADLKKDGYSDKVNMVAIFHDELGRNYKSDPFIFDMGSYLKAQGTRNREADQ